MIQQKQLSFFILFYVEVDIVCVQNWYLNLIVLVCSNKALHSNIDKIESLSQQNIIFILL